MNTPSVSGLNRAIQLAGGPTALARAVGVSSHNVVLQWQRNRVPAEHCPVIERITGVPCEELRPDVEWAVLRGASDTSTQAEAGQGVAHG